MTAPPEHTTGPAHASSVRRVSASPRPPERLAPNGTVDRTAPVAQWIEQRFPKPRAQVRFLSGALSQPPHKCHLCRYFFEAIRKRVVRPDPPISALDCRALSRGLSRGGYSWGSWVSSRGSRFDTGRRARRAKDVGATAARPTRRARGAPATRSGCARRSRLSRPLEPGGPKRRRPSTAASFARRQP